MDLLFLFNPLLQGKDAIEFLKEKGIIFKDRYHILDQLDKKEPLAYYLEKIAGDRK